jgi:hypothetical protein
MLTIEDKMAAVDKNVKSRTLYGAIGFFLIIISGTLLGYFSYLVSDSLLLLLGIVSLLVFFSVTMIRLFVVKRRYDVKDNALSIKASLQHKLSRVKSEIQFYLSIVWKVMAPMSISLVLILVAANASLQMWAFQITFYILSCYFSYVYNKRYVAKNLTPIKEELEANLKVLCGQYT